tara:strand:+ start:198 stop:629 length:432 start_codon:yes stop_codon:yes gene_type:complete
MLRFIVPALGWFCAWVIIGLQITPFMDGSKLVDSDRAATYLSLTPYGPSEEDVDYYVYTTLYSVYNPETGMHTGGEAIVGQNIAMVIISACSERRRLTIRRADISPDGGARVLMSDFSSCVVDISGRDFQIFLEEILALPERL